MIRSIRVHPTTVQEYDVVFVKANPVLFWWKHVPYVTMKEEKIQKCTPTTTRNDLSVHSREAMQQKQDG